MSFLQLFLTFLFTQNIIHYPYLPNEDTLEKNEILEAYLSWNKNIQETCR